MANQPHGAVVLSGTDMLMDSHSPPGSAARAFDLALLSDVGTNRENNEDACGSHAEGENCVVFAVADGVGGYEGGEIASAQAIEVTLSAFRESPPGWGPAEAD